MKRLLCLAMFVFLVGTGCSDHAIEPCNSTLAERVAGLAPKIEKITGKKIVATQTGIGPVIGVFEIKNTEYNDKDGFDCVEYAFINERTFERTNTEGPTAQTWDAWFLVPKAGYVQDIAYGYKLYVPPFGQHFVQLWKYREQRDKDGKLLSNDTEPLFVITYKTEN